MAIDPTISMNVAGGGGPSAPPLPGGGNVLGAVAPAVGLMQNLTALKAQQATLDARMRVGQIVSQAPDLESGLALAAKDPWVAAYGGAALGELRQMQQTMVGTQGLQATQNDAAIKSVIAGSVGGYSDPAQFIPGIRTRLAALPPEIQARSAPAVQSYISAMTDGLPGDASQWSPAQRAEFNKRVVNTAYSSGMSAEALSGIIGKPITQDMGGYTGFGVQAPAQAGGGATIANAMPRTLAPTVTDVFGPGGSKQPTVVGGELPAAAGAATSPPSPGNALGGRPLGVPSPTQEQTQFNEKAGGNAAELQNEMATRSEALPGALKRIDLMTQALGGFQAGGGAELRQGLAKGLQALRNAGLSSISPDMINEVGNQSLSDNQVFNSVIKPFVTRQLAEDAKGTGRVMRSEVDAYLQLMDSTQDPKALMTLLNQARYSMQVGFDQSQKFLDFRQALGKKDPAVAGLNLLDFFPYYAKNFNPAALPATTPGGMNLGPAPEGVARGAGGATGKPALRWDPTLGRAVPNQ